jgi:hypothetical protein
MTTDRYRGARLDLETLYLMDIEVNTAARWALARLDEPDASGQTETGIYAPCRFRARGVRHGPQRGPADCIP